MRRALLCLLAVSCGVAADSPARLAVPELLRELSLTYVGNLTATLSIEGATGVVYAGAPVDVGTGASDFELTFEGVPPGTYTFRVAMRGDVGSLTGALLLEFRQDNLPVSAGANNPLVGSSSVGEWTIPDADDDGDGMRNLDEAVYGLDPGSRLSRLFQWNSDIIDFDGWTGNGLVALAGDTLFQMLPQGVEPVTLEATLPNPVGGTAAFSDVCDPCALADRLTSVAVTRGPGAPAIEQVTVGTRGGGDITSDNGGIYWAAMPGVASPFVFSGHNIVAPGTTDTVRAIWSRAIIHRTDSSTAFLGVRAMPECNPTCGGTLPAGLEVYTGGVSGTLGQFIEHDDPVVTRDAAGAAHRARLRAAAARLPGQRRRRRALERRSRGTPQRPRVSRRRLQRHVPVLRVLQLAEQLELRPRHHAL
jgi:hypothetical protein